MAYDGEAPQASIVTGLGMIAGREVLLHADDSSVKGGAWYPLSVKKIVRVLDILEELRADRVGGVYFRQLPQV